MSTEEHGRRGQHIRFNEDAIKLAVQMVEELQKPLEVLYYLMDHGEQSVVLILLSSECVRLDEILIEQKRDTDIMYEIDKEKSIYALLCQETKVDGGYIFEQRLEQSIVKAGGKKLFSAELEIKTTKYQTKDVIMKLLDMYLYAVENNKDAEVVFRTLA